MDLTGVQKAPRGEVARSWAPAARAMGGMLPPTSMVGVTLTGLDLGVCSNVVGRVQ